MPLDQSDLPEPEDPTGQPGETEHKAVPRIAGWVQDLPRLRRGTDFDGVIDQIRASNEDGWAVLESGNGKGITANKVSTLKNRYPDIEFKQASGQTFARPKSEETSTPAEVLSNV